MALWAKAKMLPDESFRQIRATYGEHFPLEVRHYLAPWIEENIWANFEAESFQQEHLVEQLCLKLESTSETLTAQEFLGKVKLMEAAKMIRERYSSNPMQLFNFIRQCLATELKLVQNAGDSVELPNYNCMSLVSPGIELLQQLDALKRRTQESAEELKRIDQEYEAFALQYHECTKLSAYVTNLANQPRSHEIITTEQKLNRQKETIEQNLNKMVSNLVQVRLAMNDRLKENIQMIKALQSKILDEELIRWKREQQLSGNGTQFHSTNLENIQDWCESLAEIVWSTRQQIREADLMKHKLKLDLPIDILPQLDDQISEILKNLVSSTFVIEKQPPQVMKTNTRFTASVRLLVGGKLNVNMVPPQVKVMIISEQQANTLSVDKIKSKNFEGSGEILNSVGTMEYQPATRQLSVAFRNMQLKKIKRAEKKGTESVMDEKFALFFQSKFAVGGGELVFHVWTLSLPVVVIVHGNQEPHAWATVTWDNAFAEPGRVLFAVPEKVQWSSIAEALSTKFKFATGRGLNEDNLNFLRDKAFRGANADNSTMLSWGQFCKEPLLERNFTFWEWFYAVMKLTREHLRGPWVDGVLLGFVRKKQAEEMLMACAHGTFLLRFSDSELGGVTIAWVTESSDVFMLQPFTSKDFAIRSIADRINDLPQLVNLYPEILKDHAFGKYYTPYTENQPLSNGYVKPLLVTHVPGWGPSYSSTPQHMYMQSPDHCRDTPSVASSSSYMGNMSVGGVSHPAPTSMVSDQPVDYLAQIDLKTLDCFDDFMNYPQTGK